MENVSKEESESLVDRSTISLSDHHENEKDLLISSAKNKDIKEKLSTLNGCVHDGDVLELEDNNDTEEIINCFCPGSDNHNNNKFNNSNHQRHIFANVVVNNGHEASDIDTDEEDYHIRLRDYHGGNRHNKSDSGHGSSVETSSLKSNSHELDNDYVGDGLPSTAVVNGPSISNVNGPSISNVNGPSISNVSGSHTNGIRMNGALTNGTVENSNVENNLENVLDDMDLSSDINFSCAFRKVSVHSRSSPSTKRKLSENRKISESSFTDIPLHTPPPRNVNTFEPFKSDVEFTDGGTSPAPLKPPSVTDLQPKTSLLKKPSQKSWKIFGKVVVPVAKESSPKGSPTTLRRNKNSTIASSTTGLIFENRPAYLPPKSEKEEQRHREQYEEMLAAARRKELKDHLAEKKRLKERRKLEDQLSSVVKIWREEIIPNWENCKNTKKVRDLWWSGIPPSVRGTVWGLAIGNALNLTADLFYIYENNAKEKMSRKKYTEPTNILTAHNSESSLVVCKENALGLITLDVSRTFPALCIFQKGGPYHEPLRNLLGAYTCHRPDVGYVQGMSFLAAMLLLNMELSEAFIAFANLINRSCQMAFFMVDQNMMEAYYRTFDVLMEEHLPRLHGHFRSENLSHDIYLIDWIFTLYSKSLPLDTACRVWDLFCRDGEEFLFRTALGILLMHQEALLEMEFFRLAQYLTKLSNAITADQLFHYIEKINFSKQKYQQTLSMFKTIAKSKPIAPT